MSDDINLKKAAAQSLYNFRKEHGEEDLILVRTRLLSILNDESNKYTVKEIIEAGKALSKLHGAYGQEKPLSKGDGEPKDKVQEMTLTPEQEARLSAILNPKPCA